MQASSNLQIKTARREEEEETKIVRSGNSNLISRGGEVVKDTILFESLNQTGNLG